jgi:serine/threonine protein kinase
MEPLSPGDPERIGRYSCVARLGTGGIGQVFLARADDGAQVALKVVHTDLAEDPAFHACFAREAAAMRRVSGPYTARLFDAGAEPRPWLAMAHLPGPSLEEAVARHGPLSVGGTRRLGASLAEALGWIHRAGVVHRDVKPGNILLTAAGPRLIDFGNAGGRGLGTSDRSAGSFTGTPAYMAPEHRAGGPVAFPADVFSLGRVLVFCRMGDAGLVDPVGDEGLRAVITGCLAEDPARRPGTEQLVTALSPAAGRAVRPL